MSLEPFNPDLNQPDFHHPELVHPELLHRALENELEAHEIAAWETLRLEPEVLKAVSNLEFVKQELRSLPREDRKSTRLNSSHVSQSRMPSSA